MADGIDDRTDVIEGLTEDHRRIERLLTKLDEADEPAELRSLFLQIVGELAAHEACEQQVVFPALRTALPGVAADMAHCVDEHEEVNALLDEMRGLTPSGPGFLRRAGALSLELRAHFAEEEELFERFRSRLGRDELAALARQAHDARCRAPAFPL